MVPVACAHREEDAQRKRRPVSTNRCLNMPILRFFDAASLLAVPATIKADDRSPVTQSAGLASWTKRPVDCGSRSSTLWARLAAVTQPDGGRRTAAARW